MESSEILKLNRRMVSSCAGENRGKYAEADAKWLVMLTVTCFCLYCPFLLLLIKSCKSDGQKIGNSGNLSNERACQGCVCSLCEVINHAGAGGSPRFFCAFGAFLEPGGVHPTLGSWALGLPVHEFMI